MANPWLRLYAEFATDPKVQMMSEAYQRRYLMILCLRCSNGPVTLHDAEVAFQLRISDDEWMATKAVFLQKNLIADDNNPTSWDRRQFCSDSSAARVAAHRAREKTACNDDVTLQKRPCNATVTPPDTDTDTDTETETEADSKTEAAPSVEREAEKPAKRKAQTARGTRLSPDWIPSDTNLAYCRSQRRDLDPARVADNFRDYWTAKPGAGATKLDWDAAWRTWVRNERGASPHRQTLNDQRKATLDELTGRTRNGIPQQPTEPRDITGESWLIA